MVDGVEIAEFELINKNNVGLAAFFSVNPDSCENPSFYKQYIQFSAIADMNYGRTVTHLFIDKVANRIMGFVSLRASSLISYDESGAMLGEPSLEIFMLAVDKDYERRKVGTALIDFVLSEASILHNNHIGIRNIVLAADSKAIGFYDKMFFDKMNEVWNDMPKDPWCIECIPMVFVLDFESEHLESFMDYPDNDDDE